MPAVVCLALLAAATLAAQTERFPKYSRVQRLAQWTAAVERHQPGQRDAELAMFGDWNAREFAELKITVYSALQLVRDPSVRTFYRPPQTTLRAPSQVFYSRDELRQLLELAKRLRILGENHLLHRGAMLHTDAVVLGTGVDSNGGTGRSNFFIVRFDDGQGLGNQDTLGQWDFARFLLDQVRPDAQDFRPKPSADEWVRQWYRTRLAFMLSQQHFDAIEAERGVALFPNDIEVLFLAGVVHETLSSAAVQEPFRKSDDLRDSVRMKSSKGELGEAEDLLRRAVKREPGFAEARLHLGRVLLAQEDYKAAVTELTQALSSIRNETLQYYGRLFLGQAAAESGDTVRARTALEGALQLAPSAQSPLLALSQLAYSRGDVAEASARLARVAEPASPELDDPWWLYHTTVGRFFPPSYEQIVEGLRQEVPR
jgi:tetratricopeptide (TPR) repeat protein